MRTYGQMLEAVDKAIQKIEEGAQRYEIDGRVVWRADLAELRRERKHLIAEIEKHGANTIPGMSSTTGGYMVQFL